MFTDNDLRELLEFTALEPVLSVYLNTNPSEGNADAYKLRLRTMLKEINLPQDVSAVERYIKQEYKWSGRGIAMFSCAASGFFRAFPLAIPVPNMVHASNRPIVRPLADLLESFGGYGVVLVDKQGARLFLFHLGELVEQEGTVGKVVKHTKRGGASSMPGRRGGVAGRTNYMEEVVERNMKDAAEFAIHFFEENRVRRILIGGTDENVALFRSLLPKAWQSLVMGSFAMGMTASHLDVLNRTMQIGSEVEQQREIHLVEQLLSTAAKGGAAIAGLENTLAALNQDRINTLVIAEGHHQGGYQCTLCGALTARLQITCPVCSKGKMREVLDIVDSAVVTTMRKGGMVEVVHANPQLEKAGLIGALLRY